MSLRTDKNPILIVGLPRSGTTWLASVLNTAKGVKYFYEPFNKDHVAEAKDHWLKYLRDDDEDPEFSRLWQDIFSGRLNDAWVRRKMAQPYNRLKGKLSFLPGRVLVKDVYSTMSLSWISKRFSPRVVIITRHPCALACSWANTFEKTRESGRIEALERLINQQKLMDDFLSPFADCLRGQEDFFHNLGLFYGANHFVLEKQRVANPDWIFIRHEDLCKNPLREYQNLFENLNLEWTSATDSLISRSTSINSGKAYSPFRESAKEPEKWKNQLHKADVEKVLKAVQFFDISCSSIEA